MAKRNSKYWEERFEILEETLLKKGEDEVRKLNEEYLKAIKRTEKDIEHWYLRLADNNGISIQAAQELLSEDQLKEFHWDLEEYIKRGKENVFSQEWNKELENASAKVHITNLEEMKIRLRNQVENLSARRETGLNSVSSDIYEQGYYQSIYELQKELPVRSFDKLKQEDLQNVVKRPWNDGKTFSDRIWKDKDTLVNKLETELEQALIRGDSLDKLIKSIDGQFHVGKSAAGRLVMTESAYFASLGQLNAYKQMGVEKYKIVATLDLKTSNICRHMDGMVLEVKYFKAGVSAPPFHCWCRSCTAPYVEEETGTRMARNHEGKNYYVPADMDYQEWYKKYVKGNPKEELEEKKLINKQSDKEQHEEYKKILGKEYLKSFADFQEIKYNDDEKWNYTKRFKQYLEKYPSSSKKFFDIDKDLKELGIKKGVALPPISKQAFIMPEGEHDPYHIMNRMLKRHITDDKIRGFMNDAKCMFVQWNGQRQVFYGEKGITVITKSGTDWIYKTAWGKEDFDEETLGILEVINKYVK